METRVENILDVTVLDPRAKHPTIFKRFDELHDGESLTIYNDHDPKPLYYQLINERGEIFNWEYLEEGPLWWKVKITKSPKDGGAATVGQLAASDLRKAEVFKKYGIDFCCGGKKTVKEVCSEKGLDVLKVEKELQQAVTLSAYRPLPFNEWSPDFLADYIVNTHHSYVRKRLPEIRGYAAKVAAVHGERHEELVRLHELVEELNQDLFEHLMKEEKILFPFIRNQVNPAKEGFTPGCNFGSVQVPIDVMEHEHDSAGRILAEIRELTNDYLIPSDACASYSLLFKMLEEFEADLHIHIHLENNILFPKALELERNN
jgi:regulator of cell morphogenesis and NO signaling